MNTSHLLILFLILFPLSSQALSTSNVSVQNPTYSKLDLLYSFDLIDNYIKGHRPYSRKQVAQFIIAAQIRASQTTRLSKQEVSEALDLIDELEKEFSDEIYFIQKNTTTKKYSFSMDSIQTEIAYLNNHQRNTPTQMQGATSAIVSPLTSYKKGRHYSNNGITSNFSAFTRSQITQYFSFAATPLIEIGMSHQPNFRFNFETANLKFSMKNISIQLGRDEVIRGFGNLGGIANSINARSMDKIEISNDLSFQFPWAFKFLGSHKISAFASHMGPENVFNDVYLAGWSWHTAIAHWLEAGASHMVFLGGDGQPNVTPQSAIKQFIGFLPSGGSLRPGDSLFEFGLRAAIPALRYTEFYLNFAFDDFNAEPSLFLLHDSSYFFGIFIPRLTPLGKLNLRVELQNNSERMFKHDAYRTGKTLNNNSFGTHMGPGSMGIMSKAEFFIKPDLVASSQFNLERYSADEYRAIFGANGISQIIKSNNLTEELRFRFTENLRYQNSAYTLISEIGYEHIRNFNFIPNESKNSLFILFKMIYSFRNL